MTKIQHANSLLRQYQIETDNFTKDLRAMSAETLIEIKPVSREALSSLEWLMSFAHPKSFPAMRRAYAYLSALRDLQSEAYKATIVKWDNETTRIENWIKARL